MDRHFQFLKAARDVGYAEAYRQTYGPMPGRDDFIRSIHPLLGRNGTARLTTYLYGSGGVDTVARVINPELKARDAKQTRLRLANDLVEARTLVESLKGKPKEEIWQIVRQQVNKRAADKVVK